MYRHVKSYQETVTEAIRVLMVGTDFEDVICTVASLCSDFDTLTCITGNMTEAFYGVPQELKDECQRCLADGLLAVVVRFWSREERS